jgi:hypothetical protein
MYLVLCVIVLFGMALVIYGISNLGGVKKQKKEESSRSGSKNTEMVARLDSQMPARFDPDFIQRKMADLQHSPNLLDASFKSLEMRFRSKIEMKVLEKIKDYNEVIASGISSEAEINQALAELEQAKYQLAKERDPSYRQLKWENDRLELEESIAQRKHTIGQLSGGSAGVRSGSGKSVSPEEYRQRDLNRMDVKAEDMLAQDNWRRTQLGRLDDSLREELAEVAGKPWPEEEKKKQCWQIKARYAALKDEILKAKP